LRTERHTGSRGPLAVLLYLIVASTIALASQQNKAKPEPNPFEQLPFEQWAQQGKIEQLPWKTAAFFIGLSHHQRLVARFSMEVKAKVLARRGNEGHILGLVQLTDATGKTYRHYGTLEVNNIDLERSSSDLVDYWDAFVLPGTYTVDLALYHSATGEHSFVRRTLSVPALKNDPLLEAWRNLPTVEFVDPAHPPDKEMFFHPEIQGKLYLPLVTRSPVELEVLWDLTPSELFAGSQVRYNRYLIGAVPAFKAFSQIAVQNGSLDMAILELLRQEVTFEDKNVKTLNWPQLKDALNAMGPATVNVKTLEVHRPTPVFLRDELARRLNSQEATAAGSHPVQVFIIFGSSLSYYSFKGIGNKPLPANCNCRVYYLEYDFSRANSEFSAIGNVEKMLRPLNVRSFRVHSPEGVRGALAKILSELAEM
jgi:hypothetical protein